MDDTDRARCDVTEVNASGYRHLSNVLASNPTFLLKMQDNWVSFNSTIH